MANPKRPGQVVFLRISKDAYNYVKALSEFDECEMSEIMRRAIREYMLAHPLED